ncbi:iron chelate uptake ABC transporter family permease subunit [Actinoplanes sp. NEAU-A12]|uniref:Iron chelate uptake ABC transporter family permease subunit n=1 Tax=Actinoplanes sandaracinus TaxID=3045177 RepID=A0ABT6WYF6_9ACTN|nr:iron chelate uptake ABC transporter family permease subunit [Actinoplanes sandaracinus]MDI6104774.1 iron chelate uptake ABC transporter family permease subunit [Actinoplanes sandaracinus]
MLLILAAAGLLASVVGASLFGTANLGPLVVVPRAGGLVGRGGSPPAAPLPRLLDALIWESRIPRVLLAAAVGIALAVSGTVLQSVTRNALADPYLLGVSSGASTGAVAVLMLGIGAGGLSLSAGAFIGALVSFGVLLILLGGGRVANPARVVLTGVLVSQFFAAVTSVVLMVSGDANSTRGFTYWLLGSLAGARWQSVIITGVIVLIGVVVVQFFAPALDAFTFGWDSAAALGINVTAARIWLMILTAVMTAAAVAASGAIGFLGLLVPHAVRIMASPMHRGLLPLSALVGATFLIWVDTFARTAFSPHELPAGVITALLGAPAFALVLRRVAS